MEEAFPAVTEPCISNAGFSLASPSALASVRGSLYLAVISLIPAIAFIFFNAQNNFPFGGTSILIVVGVGLDTVKQIESQLQQRNYEGFLK